MESSIFIYVALGVAAILTASVVAYIVQKAKEKKEGIGQPQYSEEQAEKFKSYYTNNGVPLIIIDNVLKILPKKLGLKQFTPGIEDDFHHDYSSKKAVFDEFRHESWSWEIANTVCFEIAGREIRQQEWKNIVSNGGPVNTYPRLFGIIFNKLKDHPRLKQT